MPATVGQLHTIDDFPSLANIHPPEGMYTSAKLGKGRARGGEYYPTDIHSGSIMAASATPQMSGHHSHPPTFAPYPTPRLSPTPEHREGSSPHRLNPPNWAGSSSAPRPVLPNPARLLPPALGLRPAPQAQSPYSPRHPLDNEALRSLGRNI